MIIISQNINQSKRYKNFAYEDKTNNDNCYNKLLNQKPDIIILEEVTYPQNVEKALTGYTCYYNSDKYISWKRYDEKVHRKVADEFLCNKILIAFNNNYFKDNIKDVTIDEDRYMRYSHIDYLKISFMYNGEQYNVLGLRLHHDYDNETNDVHNMIVESILKENIGTKTIIAGDFNNGFINKENKKNYENYEFNIHTLNRICDRKFNDREPQYKLVTVPSLNIKSGSPIDYIAYNHDEWTHQLKSDKGHLNKRPIDHFIISKHFDNFEYELVRDPDGVDKMCELYYNKNKIKYKDEQFKTGIPDHRIIKLTIMDK